MSRRLARLRRFASYRPAPPPVPVALVDALDEELRTLETAADLLGMAGDAASADRRTLHGLALTIRGACDRMRRVLE